MAAYLTAKASESRGSCEEAAKRSEAPTRSPDMPVHGCSFQPMNMNRQDLEKPQKEASSMGQKTSTVSTQHPLCSLMYGGVFWGVGESTGFHVIGLCSHSCGTWEIIEIADTFNWPTIASVEGNK